MSRQSKIVLSLICFSAYPFIFYLLNIFSSVEFRIYATIGINLLVGGGILIRLARERKYKLMSGAILLFPIYFLSSLALSAFDYFKSFTVAHQDNLVRTSMQVFNWGVDYEKRDIFATMVISGFNAFSIVLIAIYFSLVFGVLFGVLLASKRKYLNFPASIVTQFFEIIPQLFFVLISIGVYNVWASYDPENRLVSNIAVPLTGLIIGISSLPFMSRVIQNRIMILSESRFVEVLKCSNVKQIKILFYNILWKNTISEILVQVSYLFGATILLETALGYAYKIGFGDLGSGGYLSWGKILAESRRSVLFGENLSIIAFPIIVTLMTILGANIIGDDLAGASRESHKK